MVLCSDSRSAVDSVAFLVIDEDNFDFFQDDNFFTFLDVPNLYSYKKG